MVSKFLGVILLVGFWSLSAQAESLPRCIFKHNGEAIVVKTSADVGESGFVFFGRTENLSKTKLFDFWFDGKFYVIRVLQTEGDGVKDLFTFSYESFDVFEVFQFKLSNGDSVTGRCKE
jgi:hypothetical protein